MFKQLFNGVACAALSVFIVPAQAGYSHLAADRPNGVGIGGSNAPIPGKVVYGGAFAYDATSGFRRVEFASDPVPYVLVSAGIANARGEAFIQAYGEMVYTFEVLAAPGQDVPVTFQGLFSFTSSRRPSGGGNYVSFSVRPTLNIADVNRSNTGMNANFGSSSTDVYAAGTLGHTDVNWTGSLTQVTGSFTGGLTVKTDASGRASRSVTLQAGVSANGSYGEGLATAYIDPRFEIDADWLALNPSAAALHITPGVGNQIAAVPEPATVATMLAGLIALCTSVQRRRRSSKA